MNDGSGISLTFAEAQENDRCCWSCRQRLSSTGGVEHRAEMIRARARIAAAWITANPYNDSDASPANGGGARREVEAFAYWTETGRWPGVRIETRTACCTDCGREVLAEAGEQQPLCVPCAEKQRGQQ